MYRVLSSTLVYRRMVEWNLDVSLGSSILSLSCIHIGGGEWFVYGLLAGQRLVRALTWYSQHWMAFEEDQTRLEE
jgi:hypothetical protein